MMIGAPIGSLIFNPLMEKIMENFPLRFVMEIYGISFLVITFVCSFGYLPFSPRFIKKDLIINLTTSKINERKIDCGFKFRKKLIKNKAFWFYCGCRFFANLAYYVPLFHLVSKFSLLQWLKHNGSPYRLWKITCQIHPYLSAIVRVFIHWG